VLAPSVYVKSSPDKESLDAFILHEGTKFTILDNLSNWTKIKIANGNIGWVEENVFQKI
jgi:SH3-like domain-containing protein